MKSFKSLLFVLAILASWPAGAEQMPPQGHYKNFKTAIYIVVNATRSFSDPQVLQREFDRTMAQVKFDKVYLEVYRDKQFADESKLDGIIQFFHDHGVEVWGGITLAAGGRAGNSAPSTTRFQPTGPSARRPWRWPRGISTT